MVGSKGGGEEYKTLAPSREMRAQGAGVGFLFKHCWGYPTLLQWLHTTWMLVSQASTHFELRTKHSRSVMAKSQWKYKRKEQITVQQLMQIEILRGREGMGEAKVESRKGRSDYIDKLYNFLLFKEKATCLLLKGSRNKPPEFD